MVTFNDAVVGAGDLSVVGAAVLNAGAISTSGAQSYSAATTLMRDTVLTAGAGGVSFGGAVDGAYALTVNTQGDTSFLDTVGATHALTSLTTDASTSGRVLMNGGSVTTTGAQSYGEAVVLGSNTTLMSTGSGDALEWGSGCGQCFEQPDHRCPWHRGDECRHGDHLRCTNLQRHSEPEPPHHVHLERCLGAFCEPERWCIVVQFEYQHRDRVGIG